MAMKLVLLTVLTLLTVLSSCGPKEEGPYSKIANAAANAVLRDAKRGLPVAYEYNAGQADGRFQFVARTRGVTLYLNPAEAVLDVRDWGESSGTVLRAELEGADTHAAPVLAGRPDSQANFFIGADAAQWLTGVPVYAHVRFANVYPGIDVDYHGEKGELEHDFIVAPHADASRIRMAFHGAEGISVGAGGDLEIVAGGRSVTWRKPVLYQETAAGRRAVAGEYRLLADGRAGFRVGEYDRSLPLVIDPVVQYLTYAGRANLDVLTRAAADANGNVYVTGYTADPSFPISPGAYQANAAGATTGNVIVAKLNADGGGVQYITQLGGAALDYGVGIAVDTGGNVYLAGGTESDNFPTTPNALKTTYTSTGAERSHCFVTKLNASGSALVYSTYLGGRGADRCYAVATDPAGNAYVTGLTNSPNFPVSEGAPQTTFRGGAETLTLAGTLLTLPSSDTFAAKLNATGTALLYATYLGGTANDIGVAIAVDAQGSAYVGGITNSFNFPVTPGAAQTVFGGNQGRTDFQFGDGFVYKLNPAGTAVVYSTYLGGRQTEFLFGLALDGQGSAYVTGTTTSTDFPVTARALQTAYKGAGGELGVAAGDAFVTKLAADGRSWVYSTFLGGARDDRGMAIAVEASGAVWVAGNTLSTDFPVTNDAFQRTLAGQPANDQVIIGDAFVTQIDAAGAAIVTSSYLGGRGGDAATSVALTGDGGVIVAGLTASDNLPATAGAYQRQYFGNGRAGVPIGDGFIARLGQTQSRVSVAGIASAASYEGGSVAPGEIVVLAGAGIGPAALTTAVLTPQGELARTLGNTRILFDDVAAPLVYVSAGQSSAVVPYSVAGKQTVRLVVEQGAERSAAIQVPVVASKPALFSADSSGRGQGAILNQDATVNSAANPAAKGSVVILYLTGEGQTDPPGADGRLANAVYPKPVLPVRVEIGGIQTEVFYAGAAPGQVAGLMQINAKIPDNSSSGPATVQVTVGAAQSQRALTVAIR